MTSNNLQGKKYFHAEKIPRHVEKVNLISAINFCISMHKM